MKTTLKLFIILFFVLTYAKTINAQEYTVSGTVRYADNNEIVTAGHVKLYDAIGTFIGSAVINQQGDYILGPHRIITGGGHDLIGFPNIDPELDFVPTGYPDQVNPENYIHIVISSNLSNIDIYVQRIAGQNRPGNLTTITGTVLSNNVPVLDAIIYAKQGEQYVGFGVSDVNGNYSIKNLPAGDYILVAHKIASQSETRFITVNENISRNVDFSLQPKLNGFVNTNPYEFALLQNYPNPFNPSTVISYSIATEGNVTLRVFNAAGQLVNELVNSYHTAGIYNAEFNASSLSSGVYFYRIEANGFTAVNKMILVK